jgi:hypothetical protein
VKLIRAHRSYGDKRERLGNLAGARQDTLYTLKAMENYPNCPIRAHVENTLRIIEPQWRAAGGK